MNGAITAQNFPANRHIPYPKLLKNCKYFSKIEKINSYSTLNE